MTNRGCCLVLTVTLSLLLPSLVKADEWDLSKANSKYPNHLQKWCKPESNLIRYSNINVPGYEPCGELKTLVLCDAAGKKLIRSGTPPYGFKECSNTPRIVVERIGPPIPEAKPDDEAISLAKNAPPADPAAQMEFGLKTYNDYISSSDEPTNKKPSSKAKKTSKPESLNLDSLTGGISPSMIAEVMKMLTQM